MKTRTLATMLVSVICNCVYAGDPVVPYKPMQSSPSIEERCPPFEGSGTKDRFYVSVHGGVAIPMDQNRAQISAPSVGVPASDVKATFEVGPFEAIKFGYVFLQQNEFNLAVEPEVSAFQTRMTLTDPTATVSGPFDVYQGGLSMVGRINLGNGKAALYGGVGPVMSYAESRVTYMSTVFKGSDTAFGLHAMVGFETFIDPNWSFVVETGYTGLQKYQIDYSPSSAHLSLNMDVISATGGFAFHF